MSWSPVYSLRNTSRLFIPISRCEIYWELNALWKRNPVGKEKLCEHISIVCSSLRNVCVVSAMTIHDLTRLSGGSFLYKIENDGQFTRWFHWIFIMENILEFRYKRTLILSDNASLISQSSTTHNKQQRWRVKYLFHLITLIL